MSVLNRHTSVIPKDAIYIGRGSKWGNPYVIGDGYTRAESCQSYEDLLLFKLNENTVTPEELAELHGKDLVCFCVPKKCHGHVLERYAEWAYNIIQLNQ